MVPLRVVSVFCLALAFATALVPHSSLASGPADGVWSPIPGPPLYQHTGIYDPARDRLLIYDQGGKVWAWPRSAPAWSLLSIGGPAPQYGGAAAYDPPRDRMILCTHSAAGNLEIWALSLGPNPQWTMLDSGGPAVIIETPQSLLYDALGDRMLLVSIDSTPPCCEHGPDYFHHVWSLPLGGPLIWTDITRPADQGAMNVTDMAVVMDQPRHRLLFFGGSNWFIDPYTYSQVTYYRGDVYELSLDSSVLTTALSSPPGGVERAGARAVYDPVGDRLVVAGGANTSGFATDAWALSLAGTPSWSLLAGADDLARRRDGLMLYDPVAGRVLFHGGQLPGDHSRNDMAGFSLGGSPGWSPVLPLGPEPVGRLEAAADYDPIRHQIVMFGGFSDHVLGDLWTLSLGFAPEWSPLAASGAPPALVGHTATYDPIADRLLVFGGSPTYASSNVSNALWALSFTPSPAWTPLSPTGGPPDARMEHSAIYDPVRHRVIIYGGRGPGGSLSDVWALSLDGPLTWTPLAPAGGPQPRALHAAIYDPGDDAMIVYGGQSTGPRPNVLELSLGASPQWSAPATGGTPPPQQIGQSGILEPVFHRLVVDGGGGASVNRSFALSLSGPRVWTELAPAPPTPAARYSHVAVYDPLGARMIVFSGGPDLASDTWSLAWPDAATPVLVSLVSARAEPGRIRIVWQLGDAGTRQVTVERREAGAQWTALPPVQADASGAVQLIDTDVRPGARYEYRVGVSEGSGVVYAGEVAVDVPVASLAIEAERNPATMSDLALWVTLPTPEPARVDLLDASGRRVGSRPLEAPVAGRQRVPLHIATLPSGLYFARLLTSGGTRTLRVALTR